MVGLFLDKPHDVEPSKTSFLNESARRELYIFSCPKPTLLIYVIARYFSHLYQTILSLSKKPESSLCSVKGFVFVSKPSNLTLSNSKVAAPTQVEAPLRDRAILGGKQWGFELDMNL